MRNVLVAGALLLATGAASLGCAYGAIAVAPSGTIYIARNDLLLFGALRKVYACREGGAALTCTEAGGP